MGTTDPSDLVFRTANTPRVRIGQSTTDNVVSITGTPDAVVGNTSADAVWDLRIAGDVYASGIYKSGGSLWMDGRNAAQNHVTSDNTLWMTTRGATNALELHVDELGSAAQGRRRGQRRRRLAEEQRLRGERLGALHVQHRLQLALIEEDAAAQRAVVELDSAAGRLLHGRP